MLKLPPVQTSKHPLRPALAVVMPLANEADCLERLLQDILSHLRPDDLYFGVLDGVSRDGTRELLEALCRRDSRVRCVWAPENRCVVDAYFAGYRAALDSPCGWILEMDGGYSHRPEHIPQFLATMAEGYDYIGGSRYLPGGAHNSPFSRRFLSWGGTKLAQWLLQAPMSDMTSGYELFTREALEEVVRAGVRSRANFFQTEIRLRMSRKRWKELPIIYANDNARVGRSSIREALRHLWALRQEVRQKVSQDGCRG